MDDIIYNSVHLYLDTLSNLGYIKLSNVDKILTLIIIEEFVYKDFRGYASEKDYKDINKALYSLYGKSCLIPYPDYCKSKGMSTLHVGDYSELARRVTANEENISEIQETQVVKTLGTTIEEIDDIIIE